MDDTKKLAKEDMAFVKREKEDDARITDRLKSLYGDKKRFHDRGGRGARWVCSNCKYTNFESRRVCGECLAVQDGATSKKSGAGDPTLIERLPGRSEVPDAKVHTIGGRCYRLFSGPVRNVRKAKQLREGGEDRHGADCETTTHTKKEQGSGASCDEGDDEPDCCASTGSHDGEVESDDDGNEPFYKSSGVVVTKEGAQYVCNYYVAPSLFHILIGPNGKTLREIHWISGSEVQLPSEASDGASSTIEIRGRKRISIRKAVEEIQRLLQGHGITGDGEDDGDFTHFVSVPLGRVAAFKDSFSSVLGAIEAESATHAETAAVVAASTAEGASSSSTSSSKVGVVGSDLFQSPSWVHFTVVMLRLPTQEALTKAREVLRAEVPRLSRAIYKDGPKEVALKGVASLGAPPSRAVVLYGKPDTKHPSTAQLQKICDGLRAAFLEAGLTTSKEAAQPLVLHATLLNATFRMAKSKGGLKRRQPFDGSWVVSKYATHNFGTQPLPPFEISRRMQTDAKLREKTGGTAAAHATLSFYPSEETVSA